MPPSFLDHLTVTAPTLEAGVALVERALGVTPGPGGQHPRMGTHNRLLRLGPTMFLEVIAPDPSAAAQDRPRWFAFDTLAFDAVPTLATWVVRVDDIDARAAASSEPLGPVEPMHRGALDWRITIPADGALVLDGVAPALIAWHAETHPAERMFDAGLTLRRLDLFHPEPARIVRLLDGLALDAPVSVLPGAARLVAHIDTPLGMRTLSC